MKIACMVMGCFAPQILAHTIPVFKAAGWDVFVHVDAKFDSLAYASQLGTSASDCTFVQPVEVFWGGYSMLQAELRLIEAARAAGDYDKFLLISDDTLPVFPPAWLNAVLGQDRDFITAMGQPPGSRNYEQYHKFFFYDHPATTMRGHGSRSTEIDDAFLQAMQEISALRVSGKKQLTIAYGSQFWALTPATMEFVLRIWAEDVQLVKSFAYSPLPDETMIQSILRSYKFSKDVDSQPIYADFHSQKGGPRILDSIAGLPFDLQPHQVFVRKVNPAAVRFAEIVAARLLAGQSAWGLSLGRGGHAAYLIDEAGQAQPIATVRLSAPSIRVDVPDWHGIESYVDREYRWTGSDRIEWVVPLPNLPPGRIRFFLPLLIAKPGMQDGSRLRLGEQEKPLRFTRHSLIAEFDHDGLAADTRVTLLTPALVPGYPPRDNRLLGLGIEIDFVPTSIVEQTSSASTSAVLGS